MTEISKKENNKVFFNLVLSAKDIAESEKVVYNKNKNYFSIPGFRKGKAPKKIIENMYGEDVFFEDAINELLPEAYEKAVEELDLAVIDQPNININEFSHGEDVTVEIDVEVKPDVTIADYKGIEIPKVSEEVTEELIDTEVEKERQLNARKINVDDRAAKDGDLVTIDFVGSVDGVEFEGGKGENHELEIGSGTFIPGFEEQIVGKNIGETFNVNVTFPEQYQEDLAGKDAVFEVKLNGISYEELPDLDDEFVKDISEFDTVEEYRKDIQSKLATEVKESAKAAREQSVLKGLVELVEVEVPVVMVDNAIEEQVKNYDYNLRTQGYGLDAYLNMLGTTMDDFKEDLREEAETSVKTQLALEEIIRQEKIEVSDEDVRKEAEEIAGKYFSEDPEKGKEMIDVIMNSDADRIKRDLETRQALDMLLESAVEVEIEEEEEVEEE